MNLRAFFGSSKRLRAMAQRLQPGRLQRPQRAPLEPWENVSLAERILEFEKLQIQFERENKHPR